MWNKLKNFIWRSVEQEKGLRRFGAGIIDTEGAFDDIRPADSGATVNHQRCLGLPALKRAVELISNKAGNCRVHVFKELPGGGREFAKDHPAYKTVRHEANPYASPADVFIYLIQEAITKGNGYAWIDSKKQLWPVDSYRVTPVILHQGLETQVFYAIAQENGSQVTVDSSEVIHLKSPLRQSGGYRGWGILDVCKHNLGLAVANEVYASTFFKYGGIADAWIELPDGAFLDETQNEAVKNALRRRFAGIDRCHSPLIISGGAKLNKTMLDNNTAQFLEGRQFTLIDLANMSGIDASFLGGASNTSYKSLTEIGQASLTNTFNPFLCPLEYQLSTKLLGENEKEDYFIEVDRSDLTRGDATAEVNEWVLKLNNGMCSWEEYRKANNLPIDNKDSDVFWRASNLVDAFAEPPAPQMPFGGPGPQGLEGKEGPKDGAADKQAEQPQPVERGQRDSLTHATLARLITRLRKDSPSGQEALFEHHHIFCDALPGATEFVDKLFTDLSEELQQVLPEQRAAIYARLDAEKLGEEVWK